MLVIALAGCATTKQIAGAINGQPYVPTVEERTRLPVNPKFSLEPPAEGKSVVYFYRTSQLLGGARDYTFFLDGAAVSNVPSGSYARVEIEPRRYKLKAQPTTLAALNSPIEGQLEVLPGDTLFVRLALGAKQVATLNKYQGGTLKSQQGLWTSDSQLQQVGKDEAVFDMSRIELAR